MCEDLPCAAVCPTGALLVPASRAVIGCAVVNDDTCLRTEGEDCRVCVNACPVGEDALRIRRRGQLEVRSEGCTGCGFCESTCPVEPSAIKVYLPVPGQQINED
jgi:ferredoxin-type protein NapG